MKPTLQVSGPQILLHIRVSEEFFKTHNQLLKLQMQGETWEAFCEALCMSPLYKRGHCSPSFHFLKTNPSVTQGWDTASRGMNPKPNKRDLLGGQHQCVPLTQPHCVSSHSPGKQLLHLNE